MDRKWIENGFKKDLKWIERWIDRWIEKQIERWMIHEQKDGQKV